jgi:uncharacterized protein (TIGR02300 family)
MTKPELGTKRLCAHCGAKFYDLHRAPITCPKCGRGFNPVQVSSRPRTEAARAPVREVGQVAAEILEARSVLSEDADTEAEGNEKPRDAADAEDEVEPDDEGLNDAAFIEERDEGATDVAEIIGDDIGIEKGD